MIDGSRSRQIINDSFQNTPILVINDGQNYFLVSFIRKINDRTLTFSLATEDDPFPFRIRVHETGTIWNILGEAISGPLAGSSLPRPLSFNAYWFAWEPF